MIANARSRVAPRGSAVTVASVLTSVMLVWAAPGWAQAARPSLDQMVEFFDSVVFGAEIDKKLASTVVAKWQEPIRITVQGQATDRHREILATHAAALTTLTGIPIEIIPAGGKGGNVTAVFVPRTQMARVKIGGVQQSLIDRLAAAGGCYFISQQKPVGKIIWAVIVVNTQREENLIKHCILEEMTQSMGLPNDTDLVRPSLFSDHDTLLSLSRADTILVRALYDQRLAAGTPRAAALKQVRSILAELDASLPVESGPLPALRRNR